MKKMKIILLAVAMASCTQTGAPGTKEEAKAPQMNESAPGIERAVCVLYPTAGSAVSGTVVFTMTDQGMKVVADVKGLTPGKHGFHIHQYGDCSSPDGTSAGGHFNPGGMKHGGPMDAERHEGDLGNLTANEQGVAHYEIVDKALSFKGKNSIIGRGIIVHVGEDDFVSQPTGNAGGRAACGTIGVAK